MTPALLQQLRERFPVGSINTLSADEVHELLAHISTLESELQQQKWRCFHCDEVFTDYEAARIHFGPHEGWESACHEKSPDDLRQVLINMESTQEANRHLEEKLDGIEASREADMRLIRKEFGEDCTSVYVACDRHNNVKFELQQVRVERDGLRKALGEIVITFGSSKDMRLIAKAALTPTPAATQPPPELAFCNKCGAAKGKCQHQPAQPVA